MLKKPTILYGGDGLWFKMWETGIRGQMWRVVKSMYVNTKSCIFLEGGVSELRNLRYVICEPQNASQRQNRPDFYSCTDRVVFAPPKVLRG